MKRIFVLILALIFLLGGYYLYSRVTRNRPTETTVPQTTVLGVETDKGEAISLNDKNYKVYATPAFEGEKIDLIPNFTEKKLASLIMKENNCEYVVNAGFYTQESRPVGYFKSNNDIVKDEKDSLLFDSFFTINSLRIPRITREIPKDPILYGIQLGPMLFENGQKIKLSIKNDKNARRIVLVVNGENKVFFLAIVTDTSDFSGPKMSELPELLSIWSKTTKNQIADAVNLDGGSASSFITPRVTLNEISPIGSAFCIKNQ